MSKRNRKGKWYEFFKKYGFSLIVALVIFELALLTFLAEQYDKAIQSALHNNAVESVQYENSVQSALH